MGFRFKLRKHLVDFFFFLGKLNCNYFVNYDYYFFKVRRVMKQSLKWHNKNFFSGHVGLKLPFYVSDVLYFNNWFFRKYFFNGMSLIFYNLNVNLQHNIRKKNILFLSIFKF